jgi:primosomal protein N' (replication factor Y) (superfamily II helicase)
MKSSPRGPLMDEAPGTMPAAPRRFLEVAVDAAGPAGGQTFTYHLSDPADEVEVGEAVLVEYGRRRAIGVVLAQATDAAGRETKPILGRVRSDGPLMPPLQIELARHIAGHYLAPPALVVRAMLAPGMLERLERVARPASDGSSGVETEWRIVAPHSRERFERRAGLTEAGTAVARDLAAGLQPAVRGLGPRQVGLLRGLLESEGPQSTARLAQFFGSSPLPALVRRGLVVLSTVRVERRPLAGRAEPVRGTMPSASAPTAEQARAGERVAQLVRDRQHATLLLEGTPGAGKSAVYAAAIGECLAAGRQALVLVPEIAHALPLLERLQHDLHTEVALLHSALSEGERGDEWRRIRAGEVQVVVGTRIAVLAPLANVGLVVVDEEHDAAYKSERTPRYQARDVAVVVGRLAQAPVILGSATPDVATLGRAQSGAYEHHRLPERVAGEPARVEIVDLRAELAAGNRGLLSRRLADELAALDTAAGEQAILLINRRGSASVVVCRDCGYVQICPECQRPLVFHAASVALRCHHCGATAPVARRCPACDSPRIRYLGGGTERVEREVAVRFPQLRVGRLDRDIVERHGGATRVIDDFTSGRLDVLVGTALVAKSLDVPTVTLVGVVSADIALNLPDERAAERTYQLLAQAVGRAGRGERPGRALIQTYLPEHPVVRAIRDGTPDEFYQDELAARRRFHSPPFGQLIKLTVALDDRAAALERASTLAAELRSRATELAAEVEVLGPVPAYVARRGGRWRFHVVLRGDRPAAVLGGDPGAPWSVDVDPESLL